jgi:hypothetical protein
MSKFNKKSINSFLAEISADEIIKISERIKKLCPRMAMDTAMIVADFLAGKEYEEVRDLAVDDFMAIPGIGKKYASAIIMNRFAVTNTLVTMNNVVADAKPVSPLTARMKVEFNENWKTGDPMREMLVFSETKTIQSDLDRYVINQHGVDPYDAYFVFCGYIKGSERANKSSTVMQQLNAWERFCTEGVLRKNGFRYKAILHGTNSGRKDEVLLVREDLAPDIIKFVSNEALSGKITEAKWAAYLGLKMPGTTALGDHIGFEIEPEEILITPEWKKVFPDQHVDFVDVKTGEVSENVVRDVIENEFDGQAFLDFSEEYLTWKLHNNTPEERLAIRKEIERLKNFSGRAPFMKPFVSTDAKIHKFLHDHNIHSIRRMDGSVVNIDHICIFGDETIFKAKLGKDGQFKDWADYCEKWHRNGHRFQVLITEHPDRKHNLPFQQLQSLCGASAETMAPLYEEEIEYLKKFNDPKKAAKLLGGDLGMLVSMMTGMFNEPWVITRARASYAKLYRQAHGGVLHGITHNAFLGKDPVAYMQYVLWLNNPELQEKYPDVADYAHGCIPAGAVLYRNTEADRGVMSRNPSTDAQAQCVVDVIHDGGEYEKYLRWSGTLYASVNSYETTRIRGDHDGDHVCFCDNEHVVKAAEEANEFTGGRLIDWDAPSTEKHFITEKSMRDYFISLTKKSQLGHFCDKLTSLVGFGTKGYNHKVACWLVMAVNVFVDASKHGMGDVVVPEFVLDFLALNDKDGNVLKDEKGNRIDRPMPIYAMQAKDNKKPTSEKKKVGSNRCAKRLGNGNGDKLYIAVHENAPAELNVNIEKGRFDIANILANPAKFGLNGCEALFDKGTYNKETKKYENEGLWKQICFMRSREMKEIADGMEDENGYMKQAATKTYDKFRRLTALKMLSDWADENGKTMDEVYDAITCYTWRSLKMPVRRDRETDLEFNSRMSSYNIMVEGWANTLCGIAIKTVYLRNQAVANGETFETFDDILDDVTSEMF